MHVAVDPVVRQLIHELVMTHCIEYLAEGQYNLRLLGVLGQMVTS